MIPKILHHVWPGRDSLREPYASWRKGWAELHPDWSMMFWRGDDVFRFEDLSPWLRPCSVAVRSDFLRWWVLRQFGGVYVDADMQCLRPIDPLLQCGQGLFLAPEPIGGVLSPALVGAEGEHPLLGEMIVSVERALQRHGLDVCNSDPVHTTGPGLLTEVARGRGDLQIHPPYFFCPSPRELDVAYARHHFTGSNDPKGWRNRGSNHNFGDG